MHGGESYESAARVTQALSAWHHAGESAGDIAFWKRHVDEFQSPRAYAIVVDLLLRKQDALAAMNLLIQWLSQSQSVPLEAGAYSFFPLLIAWLNLVLSHFGNPRSLKAALRVLGRDAGIPRKPYLPLPEPATKSLAAQLTDLDLSRFESY